MKPRAKVTSILTKVLAILSILLLAGCVSTKQKFQDDMMAQGVKPLNGPEFKTLMSGATQHEKHPTKYEGEFHYNADGTADGKIWWSGGDKMYSGKWNVNDDGLICQKWSEAGSTEQCYYYYPGKNKNEYTRVQTKGTSKAWPDGLTPVTITLGM